ncbi:protein RKD1-like [Panicum virgatum]|uniref:protein RKD1-like n=1 Tax=Panicum virgatum TaxID=38727 RepID=UPI0019D5F837|nr:protein RKD1-like [Panicum virgatum]
MAAAAQSKVARPWLSWWARDATESHRSSTTPPWKSSDSTSTTTTMGSNSMRTRATFSSRISEELGCLSGVDFASFWALVEEEDARHKREEGPRSGLGKKQGLTFELVSRYFSMPIKQAVRELDVGLTVLKRRCGALGASAGRHSCGALGASAGRCRCRCLALGASAGRSCGYFVVDSILPVRCKRDGRG